MKKEDISENDTKAIHIAIVGRPNVGKSTLFNRLIGRRKSITDEVQGTTRDRLYEVWNVNEKTVFIIDTGGVQYAKDASIDLLVDQEVNKAIVESDYVMFVCDVTGVTALDYQLAEDLRRRNKKVFLVINKADMQKDAVMANDCYRLGLGEPIFVSATHNIGIDTLIETIYSELPDECTIPEHAYEFRLSIVGEPNSGKSTLLNKILKKERAVVSEVEGTTRDMVEENIIFNDRIIRLIDTAGIKKKKKIKTTAGLFSFFRTKDSMRRTDIIVLLIDAMKGPRHDTRAIYKSICDNRKGCLILVNKWDLVSGMEMKEYKERLMHECGFLRNTPICFISALSGRNVEKALQEAIKIWENYTVSIPTKELNKFLEAVKRSNSPPPTVRFKYIVQVNVKPPTFVLFVKGKKDIKKAYMQYLTNELMRGFGLVGAIPQIILKEEEQE